MKIDYVNSLIADLRKYSCADCEGEGCFAYRDCDEIQDRLMREAGNVLERFAKMIEGRTEPDRTGQNQTYTVLEIIRLVQRATSDTLDSLDMDDYSGMQAAYEVERWIVAELAKETKNDRN